MNKYRKALAAVVGALVTAASAGLLPHPYDQWVPVVVAFATALGVYQAKNES